jgi:hypothetical protein
MSDNIENVSENVEISENILINEWNEDDDKILKEWVDKSACLKWLHDKSYRTYKRQYLRQMIPVIIISTLTGAANFAIERLPTEYQPSASLIIGGFNILAAMISTVSQFLKTSELKEGHLIAKSWDKFNRNIKIELQRNPNERTNKRELFTYSMKEFDRLVEISPDIPTSAIEEFRTQYKNINDLIKPEIADKILSSKIYQIKQQAVKIIEQVTEKPDPIQIAQNEFVNKFSLKYKRHPTEQEINDYMELRSITTDTSV